MSGTGDDDAEKAHEATRKKLEDARKKGEIVRSQDAISLVAFACFLGAFFYLGSSALPKLTIRIQSFLLTSIVQTETVDIFAGPIFGFWAILLATVVFAIFVLPPIVIVSGLIMAKQVMFTGSKLKPKLNRLSLIANFKKKFGASGLVEFLKSLFKFIVFAAMLYLTIKSGYQHYQSSAWFEPETSILITFSVLTRSLIYVTIAFVGFAAIDILWQAHDHAKKNRMSHQEMKDEYKNEEGDASMRQQRRARAEEIATNRMLLDVPKATVVITNPTHYAVALRWDGKSGDVPKCVAKGADETARKIREVAAAAGVPFYQDPPTARNLHSKIRVGMIIEEDHYKAVAIAISFARRVQRRTSLETKQ